ncbi:MAG TPA: oligoendopeptidase F [Methylomusa anaerophila]|uniref:Oligopeptidase F n=1 Tax=Methylomusa anaerophila TaxID=1930071 RepID=A0A348ANG5_9FIRM|nr:oligoendopeptidase F [Methylomusa anaerophila]BBB92613.1 oligoendopeptidase F, plasmid [Methylomusa anaerophila]HML87533.1 oligoendopeptidase F [Methylomusa anaerophila]
MTTTILHAAKTGPQHKTNADSSQSGADLPARTDIPKKYQWRIEDIYSNEEAWKSDLNKVKASLEKISGYKGALSESAGTLLACLKLRDELSIIASKLHAYSRLQRDENTADPKYQGMVGKIESLLAELGGTTAFIEPEILSLADDVLSFYRKNETGLTEYSFYFDNLARQKKHVLSPAEEELLSRSSEVTQAPENIFNMLAHADMVFPEIKDEENNPVRLSEGRYRKFIMSSDRRVRQDAFTGLLGEYNHYRNTFAATLSANVKTNFFYAKARKYNSTLESALHGDNIPIEVYDNLIKTVNQNLEPLHRYVSLKKKALGLDEINMYDLYAPLVPDVKFKVSYTDGLKLVKEGLAPLGPEYIAILNEGLASGWIDVYENKGKQTGAYCWGVYSVHPFVLLNYHDRLEDVSTLAHEMGHALHSYYSQSNQPYATSQYTIFTAEVASTTNEILLNDYLIKTIDDKQKKLYLINQYLELVRATVYRQTLFAEFEKVIYQQVEAGETLTADILDDLWRNLNTKYYGPNIVVDDQIKIEWARIPHFYWHFYVYQYVTGYAAATALAEKMLAQDDSAQAKYLNFLKSGGADYPLNILQQAGVNMAEPYPVELTLRKFLTALDQLEKLLG